MRILTALSGLVLIGTMAVSNAMMVIGPLDKLIRGETEFSATTSSIAEGYVSNELRHRYSFINLNGLFARLTGRRTLNGIRLMTNGMITDGDNLERYTTDMTRAGQRLAEFSDYLTSLGISFHYYMVPYKSDMLDSLVPVGLEDDSYRVRGDNLISELTKHQVPFTDLRQDLAGTPERVSRYYYRTDHHWTTDGALYAFGIIMNELKAADPSIDVTNADPERWERHTKAHWFLGSQGKRVGTLFAGTDDLVWHTPVFDTEMSCIITKYHMINRGDYTAANIRDMYLDQPDYFRENPYNMYIGGDYPIVRHRNPSAPNHRRILLIKNSMMVPLQTFFSTVFTEVDVIDPRHFTEATIAEYCAWTKPDDVLMLTLPVNHVATAYNDFGVASAVQYQTGSWTAVLENPEIKIEANDSAYNLQVLTDALKGGGVYRVSFENIELMAGAGDGVSAALYDWTTKKVLQDMIYDIGYCAEHGVEPWTFRVPGENHRYGVLLYAGVYGDAADKSVRYSGIKLEKME